jgi:excinuclease UvrABC nuclease subunit
MIALPNEPGVYNVCLQNKTIAYVEITGTNNFPRTILIHTHRRFGDVQA